MDTRIEAMAGYILDGLIKSTLSDGAVHEFVGQGFKYIQEETEINWNGNMGKLWNYLFSGRASLAFEESDCCNAFCQGRLYTVMELLKMMQEQQETEDILEQDAKDFMNRNRRNVFSALKGGGSLTHRELANACGLSDSSLSQFMHSIESKNYIHSRKVGRTKYYRLSGKGQKLLERMPLMRSRVMPTSQFSNGFLMDFMLANAQLFEAKRMGMRKPMNFEMQYISSGGHPIKCDMKQIERTEENEYLCCIS